MIDWIHARLEIPEPLGLPQERLLRVDTDGQILGEKALAMFASSGDSTVRVREMGHFVEISGNPAKWFQGHNLWGPDHLPSVLFPWVRSVLEALESPGPRVSAAWDFWTRERGPLDPGPWVDVVVVHASVMFDLGSDDVVKDYLTYLEGAPARNRRVRGNMWGSSTVEWTTRSLRMKAYHKREEMLKAGPDVRVQDYWEALLAWAQGKLRWEVELRSRELTRSQLRSLVLWESIEVSSVAIAYTQVVEMPDSDATRVLHLEAYPKHLRKTVALWKAGLDLRAVLPKRTFYRHRKELLEHGIDIAKPFDPAGFKELGPIPVARVPKLSELPLAQPPEWAKATPLMWEPEPIHLRKRVEA